MKKILFIWNIDCCLKFFSFEFWSHHHHIPTLYNAPTDENILADKDKSNVETFGEVDIIIFEPGGNPWKITLRNVCYILNFMTNIAITGKFRAKEVYFDNQRMRMHANWRILGWINHVHDHDVLEDNITIYTSQTDYSTNQIRNAHDEI